MQWTKNFRNLISGSEPETSSSEDTAERRQSKPSEKQAKSSEKPASAKQIAKMTTEQIEPHLTKNMEKTESVHRAVSELVQALGQPPLANSSEQETAEDLLRSVLNAITNLDQRIENQQAWIEALHQRQEDLISIFETAAGR